MYKTIWNEDEAEVRERERKKRLEYGNILRQQIEEKRKRKEEERKKKQKEEELYMAKYEKINVAKNQTQPLLNGAATYGNDNGMALTKDPNGLNFTSVNRPSFPPLSTQESELRIENIEEHFRNFVQQQINVINQYENSLDNVLSGERNLNSMLFKNIVNIEYNRAIDKIRFEQKKLKNLLGFFPLEENYNRKIEELFNKILSKKISRYNDYLNNNISYEEINGGMNNLRELEYKSKYETLKSTVPNFDNLDSDSKSSLVGFSKLVQIEEKDSPQNEDLGNFLITWRDNLEKNKKSSNEETPKRNDFKTESKKVDSATQSIPYLFDAEDNQNPPQKKKKEKKDAGTGPGRFEFPDDSQDEQYDYEKNFQLKTQEEKGHNFNSNIVDNLNDYEEDTKNTPNKNKNKTNLPSNGKKQNGFAKLRDKKKSQKKESEERGINVATTATFNLDRNKKKKSPEHQPPNGSTGTNPQRKETQPKTKKEEKTGLQTFYNEKKPDLPFEMEPLNEEKSNNTFPKVKERPDQMIMEIVPTNIKKKSITQDNTASLEVNQKMDVTPTQPEASLPLPEDITQYQNSGEEPQHRVSQDENVVNAEKVEEPEQVEDEIEENIEEKPSTRRMNPSQRPKSTFPLPTTPPRIPFKKNSSNLSKKNRMPFPEITPFSEFNPKEESFYFSNKKKIQKNKSITSAHEREPELQLPMGTENKVPRPLTAVDRRKEKIPPIKKKGGGTVSQFSEGDYLLKELENFRQLALSDMNNITNDNIRKKKTKTVDLIPKDVLRNYSSSGVISSGSRK